MQPESMCDISPERLKHLTALYPDVKGETNYDHMLNGVGVDAVVVATSVKLHFPMAKAALLAGKHVMIEKPMAASSEQCAELVEIARKRAWC
jgi:predicted dehydrogenase